MLIYIYPRPDSPLNRLSFLRSEHPFLAAALRHPSTRFVLLKELAPLTRTPSQLAYARYKDIEPLVPADLYDRSEEEMIRDYDSRRTTPQLVFLGLDERRSSGKEERQEGGDVLTWRSYAGRPYFALDVTPTRGSEEQQERARDIVETMEAKGLTFLQTRVVMTLSADEGAIPIPILDDTG